MRETWIILSLLFLLLAATDKPAGAQPERNRERAEAAFAAMQRAFWLPEQRLYREDLDGSGNPYAYHWPFGQALAASIDMAQLSGSGHRQHVDQLLLGLEAYWDAANIPPAYASYVRPPLGQGGDVYYDDNEWTALELLRVYRLTGDVAALRRAEQLWELALSGWDTDAGHAAPGGIRWRQVAGDYGRVTVSNAPAAQLGAQLAAIGGRPDQGEWAIRIHGWVDTHLRAPDELYWDSIAIDGAIDRTQWSYNQGTMIGAAVLLHQQTGNPAYLERAQRTAARSLERYAGDALWEQPAAFNTIFWKNLLLLDPISPHAGYREAMQRYADTAWQRYRDPASGLFRFDPGQPYTLLDQAAMVQVYAALARAAELERSYVPLAAR